MPLESGSAFAGALRFASELGVLTAFFLIAGPLAESSETILLRAGSLAFALALRQSRSTSTRAGPICGLSSCHRCCRTLARASSIRSFSSHHLRSFCLDDSLFVSPASPVRSSCLLASPLAQHSVVIAFVLNIIVVIIALTDVTLLSFELSALFSLFTNVLFLLCLALLLELTLVFEAVHLFFNLTGGLRDIAMVHYVTTADTFLDLHQAEVHSRTKLVQPQRYISVLFLVLKVVGQLDFRTGQVINLRLRAVASIVLVASLTLVLAM